MSKKYYEGQTQGKYIFYILRNIFCKDGDFLRFALPDTQREYSTNLLFSM
jgi:hypothetical protein